MRKCLLAVLLVAIVRPGLGQDTTGGTSPSSREKLLSKADYLRIAADLEAAGLQDDAQRLRKTAAEAPAPPKTNPAPKTVVNPHAKPGVHYVPPKTAPTPQIVVNLHVLEYSPTKLGKVSAQKYGGGKDTSVLVLLSRLQPSDGLTASPKWLSLIDALRKDGLVCPVSEASLVAIPDKPAHFFAGGEFAYRERDSRGKEVTKFLKYGTRVDLNVQLISSEWIHLDFLLDVSELDIVNSSDDGTPALKNREVETGVRVRLGQTMALSALTQQDTQTLVLFTAEIAKEGKPAEPAQPVAHWCTSGFPA